MHRLSRPPRSFAGPTGRIEVRGRLVHADDGTPLHHVRYELFFAHGPREDLVGRGQSDGQGRFVTVVQLPARWAGGALRLRVIELRPPLTRDEPLERRWRVAARATSAPLHTPDPVDLGTVRVRWWERRPGPPVRLAPDPPEEAEGLGLPLADRPVPALLAWREAQIAVPREPWIDESFQDVDDLGPAVWDGAGMVLAGRTVRPGQPVDAHLLPALRRAAVVAWLASALRLERYAVAAFRHLRPDPLGDLVLPHLRGAAWAMAFVEHALLGRPEVSRGVLDTSPLELLVDAARQSVLARPRWASLPAGWRARRAWEGVHAVVTHRVARFAGTFDGWGDPGWRRFLADAQVAVTALPGGSPDEAALVDVLEAAIFDATWWRWGIVQALVRPEGALRADGDDPGRRRWLASVLRLDPVTSAIADPVGELDPRLAEALAEVEGLPGWAWTGRQVP